MDVFADLFRGVRAHGSLFGSSTLSPPWALHFVDGAPLTLCTVLGSGGWIVPARLGGGDVMVVDRALFVGRSERTNMTGIRQLRDALRRYGYTVQAVPVQGCLHLKTAVTSDSE